MGKAFLWAAVMLAAAGRIAIGGDPEAALTSSTEEPIGSGWPTPAQRLAAILAPDDGTFAERYWVRKEFLLWWIKDAPRTIPFGTTGPAPASGFTPLPGFLGQPGTEIVLGDQPSSFGIRPGTRIVGGFWLDDERRLGVEANYLFLGGSSTGSTVRTSGQPGAPNFAIPYFDATGAAVNSSFHPQNHVPGEAIWALPGSLGGYKGILGNSQQSQLQGSELNLLAPLVDDGGLRVSGLGGFRWLQLREDMSFDVATRGVPSGSAAGSFFGSQDKFVALNNFFGAQIGGRAEGHSGAWFFQGTAAVALGVMQENADINGLSRTSSGTINYPTVNAGGMILPGGIFAQRSNGGSHSSDRFAVVPEASLRIGYQLTKALRLSLGYTFLFASGVERPGNMLDRRINSTLSGLADASRASGQTHNAAAGPALPAFHLHDSSFWAQGITFGVECRF